MQIDQIFLASNLQHVGVTAEVRELLFEYEIQHTELTQSHSGAPQIIHRGTSLYNENDPVATARFEVNSINMEDEVDVVVLFGMGLGYHAEMCERRFSGRIIVYDPSLDVIATGLGTRLLSLTRTSVLHNLADLLNELHTYLQFTDRRLVVAAIPAYRALFAEEFTRFRQVIDQALVNTRVIDETLTHRIKEWVRVAATNITRAAGLPTLDPLKRKLTNTPGILVSPGPSLDKNIRALKAAKGKALIVATNSAVHPLRKAGVIPDMITAVESLDLRPQFENVEWLPDVPLALGLNCFPELFDLPAKQIFPFIDQSVPCSEWLVKAFDWHRYPSGGSVACTIFAMLYEFGCDPIILVGQDLAYSRNESYADGATYGKLKLSYDEQQGVFNAVERSQAREELLSSTGMNPGVKMGAIEVPAWGGQGSVPTTNTFNLYRSWFAGAATSWASDRTLINATEGGAQIEGFEEESLEKTIETWCQATITAPRRIVKSAEQHKQTDLSPLIQLIEKDLQQIQESRQLARHAIRIARTTTQQLRRQQTEQASVSMSELEVIEKSLQKSTRRVKLLDSFVAGEINQLRLHRKDDCDDNPIKQVINSLGRSEKLFQAVIKGSDELLVLFEEVKDKLVAQQTN